jgi:hypothetical protein
MSKIQKEGAPEALGTRDWLRSDIQPGRTAVIRPEQVPIGEKPALVRRQQLEAADLSAIP